MTRHSVLLFLGYFLLGLALAWPALNYPWFIDDLHLVRIYSPQELANVWHQNWEPLNVETPAYRPLNVWFNHARSLVLGEQRVLHRLMNIALAALFLAALYQLIARVFGLTLHQAFWAGVLALCAQNTWFHLVWITEGVRIFGHLLAILGMHLLLGGKGQPAKPGLFLAGLIALIAAPLIREEMLAWYPIAAGCMFFKRENFKRIRIAVIVFGLAGALILGAREMVIPETDLWPDGSGWTSLFYLAWLPFGNLLLPLLSKSWVLMWGVLILLTFRCSALEGKKRLSALLLAVLCLTMPGLIDSRVTHLLPALSIVAVIQVLVIEALSGRLPVLKKGGFLLLIIGLVSVSAVRHRQAQKAMHPLSSSNLLFAVEFFCDKRLHIPPARRAELDRRFESLGMYDCRLGDSIINQLREEALRLNRRHPDSGQFFVPRVEFLDPL